MPDPTPSTPARVILAGLAIIAIACLVGASVVAAWR